MRLPRRLLRQVLEAFENNLKVLAELDEHRLLPRGRGVQTLLRREQQFARLAGNVGRVLQ